MGVLPAATQSALGLVNPQGNNFSAEGTVTLRRTVYD
jgi:hypothetical protein